MARERIAQVRFQHRPVSLIALQMSRGQAFSQYYSALDIRLILARKMMLQRLDQHHRYQAPDGQYGDAEYQAQAAC